MACPFFTTIKMITALMLLIFGFMQFMALRKRWAPIHTKVKDEKENNDQEVDKEASYPEETKQSTSVQMESK